MADTGELATQVASTARALVAAGLIQAFGHVSARTTRGDTGDGPGLLITPTTPLGDVRAEDIVTVQPSGSVLPDGAPAPLELALHRAVYRARPDVRAICRGHGAAMVGWGTTPRALPLQHGLGLLAGARVQVHADPQLVTDDGAGDAVAATLGADRCVLLLGNGGLATGADLLEAATRLWFLEERARVALDAPVRSGSPDGTPAAQVEAPEWQRRAQHSDAELRRAMAWFAATHLHGSRTSDRPSTPRSLHDPATS